MIVKPIFRIFDYAKAVEFYIGWLGFKIDWEHQLESGSPYYMQVSLDDLILHLSEHSGDCSPGAHIYIENFVGLKEFHKKLIDKKCKSHWVEAVTALNKNLHG